MKISNEIKKNCLNRVIVINYLLLNLIKNIILKEML